MNMGMTFELKKINLGLVEEEQVEIYCFNDPPRPMVNNPLTTGNTSVIIFTNNWYYQFRFTGRSN